MKKWKISLPDHYIEGIDILTSEYIYPNLSQFVRYAIRDLILHEVKDFCINCGAPLLSEPVRHVSKDEVVFELRFCSICIEKFTGKTLEELPDSVKKNINHLLNKYSSLNFKKVSWKLIN